MASITMKDLSEQIDVIKIADQAYTDWQGKQRRRRSVEQWVIKLLAPGLVLMTLIFYMLSAPHTAEIMGMITPGLAGVMSPLGWELGVLIVAILRERGWRGWMTTLILAILMGMSITINVMGGFASIIATGSDADLKKLTLLELFGRYGQLSAFYQMALFIVIPIGIAIPVIGKFAGEAFIKLTTGRIRLELATDESRWLSERPAAVYSALFQEAIRLGAGAATAGGWAQAVIKQLYREMEVIKAQSEPSILNAIGTVLGKETAISGTVAQLSGTEQSVFEKPEMPEMGFAIPSKDPNLSRHSQQSDPRVRKSDVVRWLRRNQDMLIFTDREIARKYMLVTYGLDSDSCYKSVQRARKERSLSGIG